MKTSSITKQKMISQLPNDINPSEIGQTLAPTNRFS